VVVVFVDIGTDGHNKVFGTMEDDSAQAVLSKIADDAIPDGGASRRTWIRIFGGVAWSNT
jgi:hypothetical protein